MILFFGDSLTSAENNNYVGYVEKLKLKECKNFGVSGTCISSYSLYPVEENNLLHLLYKNKDAIKETDEIFLEYGSNDISAILSGFTDLKIVLIELIKCIDYIKQINSDIKIYFITLGNNLNSFAKGQINYLKNDYFKSISKLLFSSNDLIGKWISTYKEFISYIENMNLNLVEIPHLEDDEFDTDGIHPNDKGYDKIAIKIKEIINNSEVDLYER